jgi:5-methylcytosine-specific restriction protein A
MRLRSSVRFSAVDASALLAAIKEFNDLGRDKFLKKYGFSRSSKFYLIHEQRIYDTKALVGAAYRHATGKKLTNDKFFGGAQTKAALERIMKPEALFRHSKLFEDTLGELSNLSGEFDRLPRAQSDLRKLGFSKWISLRQYKELHTRWLPGVYVIAVCASRPARMSIIDPAVVYIGETVDQTLDKRLYQFNFSLDGRPGHSGGATLKEKGIHRRKLWLSIRSFPLGYGMKDGFADLRSSQIRLLERILLHEYVCANWNYPEGNSK